MTSEDVVKILSLKYLCNYNKKIDAEHTSSSPSSKFYHNILHSTLRPEGRVRLKITSAGVRRGVGDYDEVDDDSDDEEEQRAPLAAAATSSPALLPPRKRISSR